MSIDPYADEREEDKDSPFNQGNNKDQNHGVLSPEQKDKNKQNDQNRRQEQRRKEKRMAGSDEFNKQISRSGLQDETLKADGGHSGSIRQFVADSSRWYVHWFSSKTPSTKFPVWEGNKIDDKIILYKEQKAPNGTDGFFRLTFYNMSKTGYKWIGEWVDKTESVVFPTWKINCVRKKE